MTIDYSQPFIKQLKRAPKQIQMAFRERFFLFTKNQYHPFLHNHPLKGNYEGKRSINITGDWRAVYKEINPNTALFVSFGTHSQLYK
jgi:addiction module RelE/StbE family toxin